MKKNICAITSFIIAIISAIIPKISSAFFKPETTSMKEYYAAKVDFLRTTMSISCLVGLIAIAFGIMGLIYYNRNKEIKGNVLAIIGIIIGIIIGSLVVIINFLARQMSTMVSQMII